MVIDIVVAIYCCLSFTLFAFFYTSHFTNALCFVYFILGNKKKKNKNEANTKLPYAMVVVFPMIYWFSAFFLSNELEMKQNEKIKT